MAVGRYLQGNYAPVSEERTDANLAVEGALPPDLRGRLLRNGPNPAIVPEGGYHWFTGDGMVHGIELRDGRAVGYRNRYVRTKKLADEIGTPEPDGPEEFLNGPANTHVVAHAGRIMALVESGFPHVLTPELDTVCRFDFDGKLVGAMTAHPKVDPETGELFFFGYSVLGPPFLRYHVADRSGALVKSEDIDVAGPSMAHDFAMTDTNVVFFDLPVVFDLDMVASNTMPFRWRPDYAARVGVMPRWGSNADVTWLDVEPCYVFHPLNAYEEGPGRTVIDVVRYDRMFDLDREGPFRDTLPSLWRWTLDTAAGKVIEEQLDDRHLEFPRVNDGLAGRRHRFGYASQLRSEPEGDLGGLLKFDLDRGTVETHDTGTGRMAGEGVFVAAEGATGEDDGWVLSVVYDEARDASDVVVIDASDFTAPPVATVHLPVRVPFGFHGSWVPD